MHLVKKASASSKALLVAVVSGLVMLVGSFARTVGDTGSAAFGGLVIDETLARPIWGTALGWNLVAFVAALILIHFLLGLLAWAMAHVTRAAFPRSSNGLVTWTLVWVLALATWVFAANAAWYPLSSLGEPYRDVVRASLFGITVFEAASACLLAGAVFTIGTAVLRLMPRALAARPWALIGCSGAFVSAVAAFAIPAKPPTLRDSQKPHVIFIGLDSVRADAVVAGREASITPAIDGFLTNSTVFTDTITPLARTFSAWVAIVSGKHPHTTGATVNLLPRALIDEGDTLPRMLAEAGYKTVYATDEVRFSNLDESYGFHDVVAPPMGATDFFLGFFGDAPLANLVANTSAGRYLFPYIYANRAVSATYEPRTFVERIEREVAFDRPTFLAVHLTLVHWPYLWATARDHQLESRIAQTNTLYDAALAELDDQFAELLTALDQRGVLENAVVVVFSDHGESLGEAPSVRHYHDRPDGAPAEIFGHGTNIFARGQYQTVLAMRSYGTSIVPATAGRRIGTPTSLEDLTPTFVEAFGLEPERSFDGVSLLPALRGAQAPAADRIRFIETEFNPPGLSPGEVLRQSAMAGAVKYYQVDPVTDRVSVRERYLEQILSGRQYAALRGPHLLASVPSIDEKTQHLVFASQGSSTAEWLSEPPDELADPVALELWRALSDRFAQVRNRPVTAPPEPAPLTP
jgi:arylsulfatase A-like enzyme